MNHENGIVGQLLVIIIALMGLSVILGGAKGPSFLVGLVLRPLFGGIWLIIKVAVLLCLLFALYRYAEPWIAEHTKNNPVGSEPAHGPVKSIVAAAFDYPVGDEPAGGRRSGQGWVVTQNFQDEVHFPDGAPHLRGTHLGEDWAHASGLGASAGRPVYSIADGEVVFSGPNYSYGHAVVIRHNLPDGSEYPYLISMYGHLGATALVSNAEGTLVKRGEAIGMVGWPGENGKSKTGKDWPAHLHFELRENSHRSGFSDDDLSSGGRWGYHAAPDGFLDPTAQGSGGRYSNTAWIDDHR